MRSSKKVFLILSVVFIIVMILIGYDISRKTTFPGSKGLLKESIMPSDTAKADTLIEESK